MNTSLKGGALALLAAVSAQPSHAQDPQEIVVEGQLLKPVAALMNGHMHKGGEAMIGLRYERTRFSGDNQRGTQPISDPAILAAGYTARAQSMTMDMVMLDLMYGVTEDLTVMLMPHYMWHRMEMVGIDPAGGGAGHGGGAHGGHAGAFPFGESHAHSVEGFGDTLVSASYRLARDHQLSAHATLGLWLPTGASGRKNADGTYVHYGMQPGSGTLDVEPSLTVSGNAGGIGWGGQASYRWRSEQANGSGFSFGDVAQATGWLSYPVSPTVGATTRLQYAHEGQIQRHYNGAHHHSAPPDRQENYGGDVVSAGLGVNWLMPVGGSQRPQLGIEVELPLYQDLNGIQLPRDWGLSLSLSKEF